MKEMKTVLLYKPDGRSLEYIGAYGIDVKPNIITFRVQDKDDAGKKFETLVVSSLPYVVTAQNALE